MSERPFPDAAIDQAARKVEELSRQAYEQFLRLLDLGVAPQDAIREVRGEFDQRYYEELAAAFGAILDANWTAAMVRQYQVSGVTLSRLLYEHWRTTSAEVTAIIREHAKGVQLARDLARALYEGYGFRGVEPLKVQMGNFRTLPKALRALATEHAVRATLMQAARRVAQAKLVTASLRSAYTQAFDAAIAGASRERLQKLLRVAVYEKSRYFSERIAQTELARVHADAVAAEIMADATIEVVQWRLSGAHPREDICDVFANVDRYGLGPGCFPKGEAPKPPAHPWCRCRLRTLPSVSARNAKERPESEREYLRSLGDKRGARVLGSEHRLRQAVRSGDSLAAYNRGKDPDYAVKTLAQATKEAKD